MKMLENPLQIACASDANFLPHCAAMLHSLASQHRPSSVCVNFLYDDKLETGQLATIAAYVSQLGMQWRPLAIGATERARFPDEPRFRQVAWYRILLPELLPQLPRVLYLDADMIVNGSLDELWKQDLTGHALAAVTDPLFPGIGHNFLRMLGVPDARHYFNSGLLLMNLDDWRLHRHTEALFSFIQRGIGLDSWPDQNALNAVLWQRRLPLHPRWNVQSVIFELPDNKLPYPTDEIRRARSDPSIIHYVGPYKPWHYRSKHPFRSLYFIHLEATPWRGRPIEGRTLFHILLRPLPWVLGLRIETRIRLFLLRLRKMLSST